MKKRRFETRRMLSRFVKKKKNVEHIYICNCINFFGFYNGQQSGYFWDGKK